ncbi:isochorismatase family protein [Pantoea ananatis]|uniref:isochorismatase family protein n=1 Tax=Pantoea ananas TaxID=553 RepID=UPI001FF33D0C|nr:isochorismatase family protein [Pantoea ananatis]MCK0553244.1 isochorismatase family protein [Pantoea ananatis]MDI6539727.1 isochorismatase family protein [Pantoea ananatis]
MNAFIEPTDAALLLIDHQTGLFQTVKDIEISQLKTNVTALAKTASLLSVPLITTASVPEGPNGPLLPEMASCPDAHYVPRNGEVNAWDAPAFVQAVNNTGKKTLIIAGVWTSVCVAFPALSALAAGYKVYAVIDASGDVNAAVAQVTITRLAQAGVVVTTTNALVAELQRTWNRADAADFAEIYCATTPNYAAAVESHFSAQKSARR